MAVNNATLMYREAKAMRSLSYSPYSKFSVGACVEDEHGKLHRGANIENVSSPVGVCAEVVAVSAMIAAGSKRVVRIAIAGGPWGSGETTCSPCGSCRQFISEFAVEITEIIFLDQSGNLVSERLSSLLTHQFKF